MGIDQAIVNINQYELKAPIAEFEAAISALAARTRDEGHEGVEQYWWYSDGSGERAAAVIGYRDSEAWLRHHEIAYQWPEMAALQATVAIQSLTVMGPISQEVADFLTNADINVIDYPTWAAGFSRREA